MNEQPPHAVEASLGAGIGALLSLAGVQLALVETNLLGEIGGILRDSTRDVAVVTATHSVDGPAALAAQLGLSAAKMEAFGWLSPMVAAEAAAALIDTYEGGWGLAVLTPPGNDSMSEDVGGAEACVALGTPSTTVVESCPPADATRVALTLLRREAEHRLAAKSGEEDTQ